MAAQTLSLCPPLTQVAKHLSHSYGSNATEVIKMASLTGKRWPLLGKRLSEEFPYIEAEVKYSVKEYASTLVDVLARRTRLAFLSVHVSDEVVPKMGEIMAKELGWDKSRRKVGRGGWVWSCWVGTGHCLARVAQRCGK